MSETINLERLHELSLKMAVEFYNFCKRNNLLCYLCGGGCIGAVRHKGWISWDDDLDFFMPREDYEKAIILWQEQMKESRYVMENSDANHIDGNLFFTIRDSQTTYVKPYQVDFDITHGIVLDVFPLDGYPDNPWQRRAQIFWALLYSLFRSQAIPVNHGKLKGLIARILLFFVPTKRGRYKIWSFAEKQMSKYPISSCSGITELCAGPRYMKNWYPKSCFEKALIKPFEKELLPIPVGYDKYLNIAFGDYMILPPKEKQVPSHDISFFDLENGYQKYRGKFFMVKKECERDSKNAQ